MSCGNGNQYMGLGWQNYFFGASCSYRPWEQHETLAVMTVANANYWDMLCDQQICIKTRTKDRYLRCLNVFEVNTHSKNKRLQVQVQVNEAKTIGCKAVFSVKPIALKIQCTSSHFDHSEWLRYWFRHAILTWEMPRDSGSQAVSESYVLGWNVQIPIYCQSLEFVDM